MNDERPDMPGVAPPAPALEHHAGYLAIIAGVPVKVFKLATGSFIVGRAAEADFRLDHFEVSRRHCRISWDSETGECFVEDLQSQWGTRVDNRPISGRTQLKPGDILTLGCVVLLFEVGHPPPDDELAKLGGTWTQTGGTATPVLFHRQKVDRIALGDHVAFGRDPNSDVVLNAPAVSRHHALVRRVPEGFRVVDLQSTAGSFVNGHRFDEHDLTIGDRLQIGPFFFQFDGRALHCVSPVSGGRIYAREITKHINSRAILDHITLDIAPSRFAGIIGPSGAGKSSLLEALSGMCQPNEGTILVDGADVFAEAQHRAFGYVPQEDIVHRELVVSEALRFAAKLRLPHGTPAMEIQKLVIQTLEQLGLRDRAATRIGNLSGGQRKRVSVAVELLARPPVLFLDEPTSGLDPATEFKLMELLRELADRACTVVCTTHVMENVYLMDQLVVIVAGVEIFDGSPQEAREFFGIQRLSGLYDQLDEKPPVQWREEWRGQREETPTLPPARVRRTAHSAVHSPLDALGILLQRQLAILRSDWRNYAILLGQPIILAALVSWVSNDPSLLLFFAYIATLWFGCSNAAQEIVREIAIYRRERIVGVSRTAYVTSKFLFLGAITTAQSLSFYLCLQLFKGGLDGSSAWQCAALVSTAVASVGIGSAISALSRTVMQAVVVVPLALIPLILFSGYTVPANEMKPAVAAVSRFTPAFAAQRCMDVSFLWGQRLQDETLRNHMTSYRNVATRTGRLKIGEVFWRADPGIEALIVEWVWVVGGYAVALFSLRAREKS
jgi:ABC transport system ATP-binding/permease protein